MTGLLVGLLLVVAGVAALALVVEPWWLGVLVAILCAALGVVLGVLAGDRT